MTHEQLRERERERRGGAGRKRLQIQNQHALWLFEIVNGTVVGDLPRSPNGGASLPW